MSDCKLDETLWWAHPAAAEHRQSIRSQKRASFIAFLMPNHRRIYRLLRAVPGYRSDMIAMFSREYPPRADWVRTARTDVVRFAGYCRFSPNELAEIALAVGEACNNAVEHAASTRDYSIWCEFDGVVLVIRVEDSGVGFDPGAQRETLDLGQTRGFGMFLMKKMMDETEFASAGAGSVVTLFKRKRRLGGSAQRDRIEVRAS
jgi:serine/threonine-protein kinase RsbW